jgi:hypothetical protein
MILPRLDRTSRFVSVPVSSTQELHVIDLQSTSCTIAAVLASIATAIPAHAQDLFFPHEQILTDELGRTAWVGACPENTPISTADSIGSAGYATPLLQFATNRDGDIAGWRFDLLPDGSALSDVRLPMLWIRRAPTSHVWDPILLPVDTGARSAAATGVIRVRDCEHGVSKGIFVSGWREVPRGIDPLGKLPPWRYEATLWYLPPVPGGFGAAEIVPIAPHHFIAQDDGFPDQFLAGENTGDAWGTGAIEVIYRERCEDTQPGPQIIVHATQAYRCVCPNGQLPSFPTITAHTPLRIVFDVEDWLERRANDTDDCGSLSGCLFAPFLWRLTDGYPAPSFPVDGPWLLVNREARSVVHLDHARLGVSRTGVLDSRPFGCAQGFGQCGLSPVDELAIGPAFGSLIFDSFDPTRRDPIHLPFDRYLIGAVGEEITFPGSRTTPRTVIWDPRGGELRRPDGADLDMPFMSMQYESASRIGSAGFEQIVAGWRRYTEDIPGTEWEKHPIAWFPMETREPASECAVPPCEPIAMVASTPDEIRGAAYELPLLNVNPTAFEEAAWALGCEFVGRSAQCSKPQFVGGGSLGARVWHLRNGSWQVQLLPQSDAKTEAHSVMPDGAIVVLGIAGCNPNNRPCCVADCGSEAASWCWQPVRVILPPRAADFNGDGVINGFDLTRLLAAWGTTGECLPEDLNGDGRVDAFDFGMLLASWE